MITPHCLLCGNSSANFYYEDDYRSYYQCPECSLVFVPPQQHLSAKEEKERYELHENNPEDDGYRQFLKRLFDPLNNRIADHGYGLDFGCGPGPTLHHMFEDAGHRMKLYDIFYADDPSVFLRQYDFITATEVVEHLHQPMNTLNRLWQCLKPCGFLGIMTKMVRDREAFKAWHYIRDDTHVAFFSPATFRWIANKWQAKLEFIGSDVIIFQKHAE